MTNVSQQLDSTFNFCPTFFWRGRGEAGEWYCRQTEWVSRHAKIFIFCEENKLRDTASSNFLSFYTDFFREKTGEWYCRQQGEREGGPHMAFGNPPPLLFPPSLDTKYLSFRGRIWYLVEISWRFFSDQIWKKRFVVWLCYKESWLGAENYAKTNLLCFFTKYLSLKKVICHLKVFDWMENILTHWKTSDAKYLSFHERIWWISVTLLQLGMAEICWKVGSFPLPRCRNILSARKLDFKIRWNAMKYDKRQIQIHTGLFF